MKHIITIAMLLLIAVTITAQDESEIDTKILHIAPYQQSCIGVAPQMCLVVRWDDDDDLSLFYDRINRFEFEAGFEYTLLVNVTERDTVPTDASALQYEWVETIQQFPTQLENSIWELQSLNGADVDNPTHYTLLFTEDGIVIQTDCNTGQANLTNDPFDIETTISTRAMCPPDSLDTDYLAALNNTSLMTIENGELILQYSDGQLRFAPPNINFQEWSLTHVSDIDITDETPYTLEIDDNAVYVTIICNSGSGQIELDGAVIRFSNIITTLMGCIDDPLLGVFPPETAVYSVNTNGQLILVDASFARYTFTAVETE